MGSRSTSRIRALRAARLVWSELGPLLELFATVDEVFNEPGAFDDQNIHKSLGRCYREWLKCRSSLDPDFNPNRYRQEMKSAGDNPLLAAGFRRFSSEKKQT